MTLNTDVYVLDEIDPMTVFRYCQELLAKYDDRGRPASEQRWTDTQDKTYLDGAWMVRPGNPWSLNNEPDQGLPAWLLLDYMPGGPLRPDADACSDSCDEPGDPEAYHHHGPAYYLSVAFDTAYSYRGKGGMGCGDLHAALVAELGAWLTAQGVRWLWENEFTGEIHDEPARLIDLCSGGFEAQSWFATSVMPAIVAKMASEGGGKLTTGGMTVEVPDLSGGAP